MPSLSPPLTSLLSLALATSMAAAVLPSTALAANRDVTAGAAMHSAALLTARQMAPASVLGLDGEDAEASAKLTDALRAAFKARGLSGGEEISLVEMRLTMGCSNLEPKCLSEGGEALSVDKLIYGELHTQGDDFQLELQVLDVATSEVTNQESFKVTAEDLKLDNIDARSMAIVTELLGLGDDSESVPSAGADYDTEPEPETDPVVEDEPRERQYWFGRDKDGPRWKKVGLGVGIGMVVAGGATVLGVGLYVESLEKRIEQDAAKSSGETAIPERAHDNVDAICQEATSKPDGGTGGVLNGPIGTKCRNGKRGATGTNVAIAGTIVGGVVTIVFTTLLLVHKKNPAMETARRHQFRFGATPTRGGASLGTSFKF